MKTVVIKIPAHVVPKSSKRLKVAVRLRKWCHDHVHNGWHSFFLDATDESKQANSTYTGFIAFNFTDPKEAMKFMLWAGSESA